MRGWGETKGWNLITRNSERTQKSNFAIIQGSTVPLYVKGYAPLKLDALLS